ncbi:MAG: glycosyltransferase 87 family protein [Acidimicrobiia bacterium]
MSAISTSVERSRPENSPVSRDTWLLVAVTAYGVAGYFGPPDEPGVHLATLAAIVGLAGAVACLVSRRSPSATTRTPAMLIVGCFLAIRIAEPFATAELSPALRTLMLLAFPLILSLSCVYAFLLLQRGSRRWAAAILTGCLTACGGLLILGFQTPLIDVLLAHDAAAEVVATGGSPYGEEVVVPDTSPYSPPGRLIVGYPYPPVTALGYVLGVWVLGDPRWFSVLTLAAAASCLILGVAGDDTQRRPAALLLVSLPGMPILVFLGWTEPLTLLLLVSSMLLWDRRPWSAAILGGLAIASKQYMLVVAPLFLIAAYRRDPKRPAVMALAGIASVIPSVLVGWTDLFRSTFTNLAGLNVRPDGSSIQGLLLNLGIGLRIPLAVSLGAPLAVGLLLATRAHNRREVAASACLVLTTFFLLGSQAFVNYWFLIAGLAVLAYALPDDDWIPSAGADIAR